MRTPLVVRSAALCIVGLGISGTATASVCTVTNTLDTGAESLRAAFDCANADADATVVSFAIAAAGPHLITLATPLPVLTHPTLVRGYSQVGGYAGITAPPIAVDGSGSGGTGLVLLGDGSSVLGLELSGFDTGIVVASTGHSLVAGNVVTGCASTGIYVAGTQSVGIYDNHVTGSGGEGIRLTGTHRGVVADNVVDANVSGIVLVGQATSARVLMNQVTASVDHGILVSSGSNDVSLSNNLVGNDAMAWVQVRPALDVRRRKIVLAGPILGRSGDAA